MKNLIFTLISFLAFGFSNAQELNVLIEQALKNNPAIQKFELQYNIAFFYGSG